MRTVQLLIKGKVQGVFYRASAKETAQQLGLTGWIRNTPDENVEALVSGDKEAVQEFINWCKKGPSKAVVTEVIVTEKAPTAFNGFSILR